MTERKTNLSDPTAERTADQSTQTAGGLSGGQETRRRPTEDVVARERRDRGAEPDRRYDEDADNPVLPSDDATLKTNI